MRCECEDPGCPEHKGQERCSKPATAKVSRCDYSPDGKPESWRFCEGCAQDAVNSGVFS